MSSGIREVMSCADAVADSNSSLSYSSQILNEYIETPLSLASSKVI
jgi:hypothetical protein